MNTLVNENIISDIAMKIGINVSDLDLKEVRNGVTSQVFKVRSSNPIFTNTYLKVLDNGKSTDTEYLILKKLNELNLSVPAPICPSFLIGSKSFLFTKSIVGFAALNSKLTKRELENIGFEAGKSLASIHLIKVNKFGWLSYNGFSEKLTGAFSSWSEFLFSSLDSLDYLKSNKLINDRFFRKLLSHIKNKVLNIEVYDPKLLHGDLDANHIYQMKGEFVCLIDFGDVIGGDPLFDLSLINIDGFEIPALRAGVLKGWEAEGNKINIELLDFYSLILSIGRSHFLHESERYAKLDKFLSFIYSYELQYVK